MKDRIGIAMVEAAERSGALRPGGTIIEGTSGNTGAGLALAAIVRGYKCVFTTTDKQGQEKIAVLRALGAEVIVCPTAVAPDDPRSYYSVARRLSQEIPNSVYVDQYANPANTAAHAKATGPEIWEQTDGRVTHFIAGAGMSRSSGLTVLESLFKGLSDPAKGRHDPEKGEESPAQHGLIVNQHGELAVVALYQFGLQSKFALEHRRRPGGLDA